MDVSTVKFDIIAQDAKGHDVLLVTIRSKALNDQQARAHFDYMQAAQLPARFAMVADPSRIRIVDNDQPRDRGFTCVLDSSEMLREYSSEFGTKPIFRHLLTTLVDAWLRDHVYHWHSVKPPGTDQLAAIGLLPLLDDGDTRREVYVETDSLR